MKASELQVGGNHYKDVKIQPFEYSIRNGLNAIEHTCLKYIFRAREKNGVEDVRKAFHCLGILIEYAEIPGRIQPKRNLDMVTSDEFSRQKDLTEAEHEFIHIISTWRNVTSYKWRRIELLHYLMTMQNRIEAAVQHDVDRAKEEKTWWFRARNFIEFHMGI
jgi:hypothetical protein